MSKNQKKKKKTNIKLLSICLGVILVLLIILLVIVTGHKKKIDQIETEKEKEEKGITFPYELEDGKLVVDSLFQFTGTNPDCNNEECEDTGAIQLKNCSEKYLQYADIKVELSDETKLEFHVEDIPSEQSVLAFEVKNQSYDGQAKIIKITAKTSYMENASRKEDAVSIAGDVSGIHITNISSEELKNMVIKYHCYMDDIFFGGTAYEGFVESLAAGEEIVLETPECYLGEATVTQIQLGD